ncbi:LuxR C-terminal-related transcriptional regulator [Kitasatospora sp. NPDC089509]|uniref:LuxR C-terminal-related transcriptional regulator n=1 Tax=Kitasatospora sp. NPDC089509 TaxID=3364079 RepID=UPI0037F59EF3
MLEPLGLDRRMERIYLAVLADPNQGLAELATSLGLGTDDIRDALNRLADLSLLIPASDGGRAVHVVSPHHGLHSLLDQRQAEVDQRLAELQRSRQAVASMLADLQSRSTAAERDVLELIEGSANIRLRLQELAGTAETEVLAFAPGGPQSEETLDASRPLDEQTLGKGVAMRTVFLGSIRNSRATRRYAMWLASMGAQVRTAPVLPMRMIIVDRAQAVVPVDPQRPSAGAHLLGAPGTVTALVHLFEHIWAAAEPLDGMQQQPAMAELTAQERALLHLLNDGATDEIASRRLGVSVRTIRRLMADVMVRLGARSRFQAGTRAQSLGWLDGDTEQGDEYRDSPSNSALQ